MGLIDHTGRHKDGPPPIPFSLSFAVLLISKTAPKVLCGKNHRHCDQDTASFKPHCLIASGQPCSSRLRRSLQVCLAPTTHACMLANPRKSKDKAGDTIATIYAIYAFLASFAQIPQWSSILSISKLPVVGKVCAALALFARFPPCPGRPSRGGRLEKDNPVIHAFGPPATASNNQRTHSIQRVAGCKVGPGPHGWGSPTCKSWNAVSGTTALLLFRPNCQGCAL